MASNYTAQNTFEVLKKHILVDGFPVVLDLEKSRGSHLIDASTGKKYFDFFSFFASNPIGFNHPKMNEPAFLETLQKCSRIKPVLADMYTPEYAEFVDRLAKLGSKNHLENYFFIEGGGLAVENALKAAFDWKVLKNQANGKADKGSKALHFRQAFHGRTGYTLSLTNTDPIKTKHFPKFDWPRVENPRMTFPLTQENLEKVQALEKKSLEEINQAFDQNPDDIACIIIEPIQSEGGDHHFRKEFLQELRRICDEREAILIFDEVQTGFGLTGAFWCWEHFDVKPDIVSFGKKAQVGGIAASNRLNEVEGVFRISSRINSTFGGNLADMVRCTQYMKIIEEENLVSNAKTQGLYILDQFTKLSQTYTQMTNIRGRGLLAAFDLPTSQERDEFRKQAWDLGLLVLPCGDNTIRLRPVLDIQQKDVDEAMGLFESTFKKIYK